MRSCAARLMVTGDCVLALYELLMDMDKAAGTVTEHIFVVACPGLAVLDPKTNTPSHPYHARPLPLVLKFLKF